MCFVTTKQRDKHPVGLQTKRQHESQWLTSTYTYNIRSWLTSIRSYHFYQDLYYTEDHHGNTPLYNGNISSMQWQMNGIMRGYNYSYDALNRLTDAVYGENEYFDAGIGFFSVTGRAYDKNGNLTAMQRTGKVSGNSHGLVDDLSLSYNGNQLIAVDDEANGTALNGSFEFAEGGQSQDTEYWYDAVGSLGADSNKGISTIWNNVVALPSLVQFSNGNRIKNEYSFDGMKRRATYYTAIPNISVPLHQVQNLTDEEIQTLTTTDYCGNVIYENGNLKMILTEEGFITMENGAPVYHYYTKDHQGNNRMVVKAGNNMDGAAEQYNHYYPFGGVFETNNNNNNNNNSSGSNQPYKYNGKEFDRMYGLDWYDYSARIMDPTLGRFNSIDPLAEKYPNISPYVYCLNNPVRYIDPDGKKVYFAKGVSNQFKKDFATSVQHLNSHKQGGMLKQLHKSDNVYYIAEGGEGGNSNFNSSTKTITWSSRTGLLTNNGTELSPTTILNHEVDHALQHDTDPKQQKIDGATKSEQYGNKEEERVITGSEQKTAQGLGEIKEGEVTRTDHGGTLHETTGPTKTDWKDEVIIKPDEKR